MYSEKLLEIIKYILKKCYDIIMKYKYSFSVLFLIMITVTLFVPYIETRLDDYINNTVIENRKSLNEIYKFEKDHGYDIVIDVRSKKEYDEGHLEDTINIPFKDIIENPNILQKNGITQNKMVLVYCNTGRRASFVVNDMIKLGFDKNSVHYYDDTYDKLRQAFI